MNQDEVKTMMRSFERLQSKPNKSAQNTMTLDDMWHKMPQIVMHQISVVEEYQEAFDKQAEQIAELQAEIKRLKEFARAVIREECWGYDSLDGGEVQDLAERLGLIEKHLATEADVSEFDDFEVGDFIFKFTDILKGQDNDTDNT